ncbi:hypothetical protein [Fusobacterium hominis]|uniref:Uncharacterized protein n=1 Tax=Fusobacterium hominis TaxID=2764326 RepID=A0A7G9GXJ1_9FUSO|nr:hypothetical protein [Fusobacterium hominis]QNM15523.1 hypothetical protein H9Q81_01395 [Fusobacterium hominis]
MVIKKSLSPGLPMSNPLQQLYILLNTVRGTVPLQRDIGLDPRMVDKPINIISANIFTELHRQIKKYIVGLELKNVRCHYTKDSKLEIEVEVLYEE